MSFNGSGTFLINTAGQPVVSGTVISSTAFNALTADLATGLSTAITKDGQTTVTANIPMSTYKFTGLGVGSAATDSANLSQVQSTVTKLLNSVSGADTITATASPTLAAYAAGQMFYFVAAGDNTTSVTLNIDALGAKAVTRDGSTALAAADIKSGEVIVVVYDGTRFQVVSQLNSAGDARFANVSIASSLYVGGVSTFVGNAGFSANVSIASALSVGGVAAITGATTIGGNLTLSGGTANGVLYLNGSKVATSGTDLTFTSTGNLIVGGTANLTGGSRRALTLNSAAAQLSIVEFGINGTVGGYVFASGSQFTLSANGATTTSPMTFETGAAERMRLDASGNLGLGVTPSAWSGVGSAFELKGNAYIASTSQVLALATNCFFNGSNWIYKSTSNASRYETVFGENRWFTAASGTAGNAISFTQAMTLDASGNLGIGTASPGSKLEISAANPVFTIYNTSTGDNGITWESDAAAGASRASLFVNYTNGELRMTAGVGGGSYFQSFYTNGSERMRLDSTGLGLSAGNAPTQALSLYRTGSTQVVMSAGNTNTGLNGTLFGVDTAGNGIINQTQALATIFSTSNTERMRLDSSGSLGIGTASPGERLDVRGGSLGVGNGTIKTVVSYTTEGLVGTVSNHALLLYANNAERARLTSGGDLLVGLTTGSYNIVRKAVTNDGGNTTVEFQSTGGSTSQIWYGVSGFNANAANAATKVGRDATTLRSINAGGTVNASGADYAEYMTKAGDFALAKGDVCGINADGKLTNVFANAISFVVKSTDPSYVGGDSWGAEFKDDPEGLETARQKVDRIAFAGQVPVNVLGATPGQYIVPINDNGAIKGVAVSNPTFEQYQSAVGKVIAVQDDGRALIIVKVA